MARSRSVSHNEVIADSEEEGRSQSKVKNNEAEAVPADEQMADADADADDKDDEADSDDDDEPEYEIEAILDAKMGMFVPNEYAYFVSWKGYGEDDNSWVSQEDAGNAMELIEEYWKTRPKKEIPKPPATKKRSSINTRRDSSIKRESVGSRTRKSVSKIDSDDSDIEVIEKIQQKPAGTRRRPAVSSPKVSSALSASEIVSDDDLPLKPVKKAKSNGKSGNGGKTIKAEKDEVQNDKHGVTHVEEEEDYPTLPDMEPYMHQADWEQLVARIDTVEQQADGILRVYVTLDDGTKASHDMSVVRQRCPQKLITFFESHLRWKHPRS